MPATHLPARGDASSGLTAVATAADLVNIVARQRSGCAAAVIPGRLKEAA